MAEGLDYSKVEHKDPYEDLVAAYDDAQLIKDAEYRLAHMEKIPTATSNRQLEQSTLDNFKDLLVKKKRTKAEESELKLAKRNLVSTVLYHQNYEDNKEKYKPLYSREADWRDKTGMQEKGDYYSTQTRRDDKHGHLFRGWKFHLDVNPTPDDAVTKEISEFLKSLDVEHKIAHGGEDGKGMTVYTGSYEDTRKLAQMVYEKFHDKMELPPLWNNNLMGEHFFNPLVCGRFLDGGFPFPSKYPVLSSVSSGISGVPAFFLFRPNSDLNAQKEYRRVFAQNARNNGINLADSKNRDFYIVDNRHDKIKFETLASYTMHKIYTQEFGEYYHGKSLNKFEQVFFGDYLPKKGTAERKKWDKIADANIQYIKEHGGEYELQQLREIINNYIPIDFSRIEDTSLANTVKGINQEQNTAADQADNQGRTTMADTIKLNDNAKLSMYFERYNPVMNDSIVAFLTELGNKADFNLNALGIQNLEGLMEDVPLPAELRDILKARIKERKEILKTADMEFLNDVKNITLHNYKDVLEKYAKDVYGKAFKDLSADEFKATIEDVSNEQGIDLEKIRTVWAKMTPEERADVYQKTKALDEYTQKSKEAAEMINYNRDLLYKDFLEMAGTNYIGESGDKDRFQEMADFMAKKNAFLKLHPELEDEINTQLETFVKIDGNQTEWNDEPYRITDEFKKHYMATLSGNAKQNPQTDEEQGNSGSQPVEQDKVDEEVAATTPTFKNKEDLYKAFNDLVASSETDITLQEPEKIRPAIREFFKLKDAYFKAHPEEQKDVDAYIDSALEHKEADDQYTISEYFRIAYRREGMDYTDILMGNTPLPREFDPVRMTFDNVNDGKPQPAPQSDSKPQQDPKPAPQTNEDKGQKPLTIGAIPGGDKEKDKTKDKENDNVNPTPQTQTQPKPENENKQSVDTLTDNDNNHGGNDNGNNKQDEFIVQDARVFEDNSDKNEAKFDRLKYNILLEMGKINPQLSAEELRDQSKVYTAAQNAIASLSDKDSHEFNALFADEIVRTANNEQMMKVVPPTILTQVYNYYGEEIAKAKDENVKNEFTTRRNIIGKRMDEFTDEYYTGIRNIVRDQYNFDDNVNIADVYGGYKEMIATRRPDVNEQQQAKIDAVDKKLKMDIADYDTDRGIADITKDNINQVRKNHQELTKRFENIGLDDDTNKFLSNIRFYDEKGQVVPQFINPQTNQESLTWQHGMYVKPNSQLQTMIDFARNNTIIENMSADVKSISDEDLQAAFQDRLKIQAFAWATAEENVHNALIEPDRFTDEKYLNEFKARMADPERPLHMSIRGFNAATQLSVNDTMGIIGRLASEDHIDNPKDALLKRMYAPIEKYDARKGTRFDEKGEYSVNWFKTAAWTAGASLAQKLLTYGATLGCAHAASALGLTALAPAVAVTKALPMVAGVTSMAMAGVGMYMNWKNYKKEAKANNQKPKLREFLTKQPYATTNIASTLGFAAGACLITGNVPAAAALGAGCLAVAGYGTYKEARQHGLTKRKALLQSLKKVSAIAVGGGLGSYIGSMIGVTPAWQEKGPDTPGHVEQGPDSHNYSNIEHQHATNRLDDPRFSEFLNRFHVAPDLQDPSDPNVVSSDAVTNLRSAITQAIGDDRQFYTDIANNPQNPDYIPNTDVLSYKFEQLAYLAPKPDTPINTDYAVNVLHVPAGTTVGEYLSMKMPDGSDMNYIDALKEVVSTGKSSNPDGLASMLTKIDNVIGMQIDDNVNDAGKITLFGTGPEAHPVQSFNENADAGYDIGKHFTMVAGKVGEVINHGGEKLFGLGYWEPVKGAFSGMKKRIGAIADKIIGVKTSQTPPPVQTPPTDKTPPTHTPPTDNTPPTQTPPTDNTPPRVIIKIPEEQKYLNEEYWMIHGYNPAEKKLRGEDGKVKTVEVNPMLDAGYKAYVENVEKERIAAGGKPMLEFLQERRKKIDDKVLGSVANFNGSYAQRVNVDVLDPLGHKQILQKQAELKEQGLSMSKEEIDKAIKWPTSQELGDEYKAHRPTSRLMRIIRDAFLRKDNGVNVLNPKQRATTEINGKIVDANKKVFSFNDFINSAEDTLTRTTPETSRDAKKAPVRRTLDEMGKTKRLDNR